MKFTLRHFAYCGMAGIEETGDKKEMRAAAAAAISRYRRRGFPVVILERGWEWEIQEPANCAMVPDACGTLALRGPIPVGRCRDCGNDIFDDAEKCCYAE